MKELAWLELWPNPTWNPQDIRRGVTRMHSSAIAGASSLADFSSAALILPRLSEQNPPGVIQELSRLLQQDGRILDLLPFCNAVLNRELLVSTAMDYGMAFPHARVSGLKELRFALGRAHHPIAWGPGKPVPITLVFLIAVPATDAGDYINLISGLARLGKESRLLDTLQAAQDATEIFSVLKQVPIRQSKTVRS
jgi:mannitol/fructose-specific phosphotransferase system IIA component (Ntr-type)